MPDFTFQLRLTGDKFNGHYTNGLSLANGEGVRRCKMTFADDDKTVYQCEKYTVTAYHIKNGDVYECFTVFENTSDSQLSLELLSSFCIENVDADIIHRATSFWSAEGKILSQPLTQLNMERSWSGHGTRVEKFGQVGSMPVRKWFPFVCLESSVSGRFIAAQLYCASSWQMEICRNTEPLTITGGLADYDYGHWCKIVGAGESFVTPKAVVAVGTTLNDVCDKLVKAQKPDISPVDRDMPVVYNEYCTTWGNPTKENIEKIATKLEGTGIRYLVIDSGWYKQPDQEWWDTIGDWKQSKELFPDGISEISDIIKSHGLIPGIWFEFEKCAPKSEIYNNGEHLLTRDGVHIDVDGQRFLDMRDEWCHDYLRERVTDFLRDNGFGYIKVDYNDSIGVGCDGAESLGEGLRQTVLGTQKFFRQMKADLPDLVIEGCSSGGHRLEPSMMELVSQASFSDAHECKSIPIIAANCQRMIRPEQCQIWAVLRAQDDIHRVNYSLAAGMLGRLCLSGEIFDINEECWDAVLQAIVFYDRIKDIIRDGKTTIIDSNVENYYDPCGYQIVLRELGNRALMIVHTFAYGANPPFESYLDGWNIVDTFGSELDKEFRGRVYLLEN